MRQIVSSDLSLLTSWCQPGAIRVVFGVKSGTILVGMMVFLGASRAQAQARFYELVLDAHAEQLRPYKFEELPRCPTPAVKPVCGSHSPEVLESIRRKTGANSPRNGWHFRLSPVYDSAGVKVVYLLTNVDSLSAGFGGAELYEFVLDREGTRIISKRAVWAETVLRKSDQPSTQVLLGELQKDSTRRAAAFYQLIGMPGRRELQGNAAASTSQALIDRAADRQVIAAALISLLEREQRVMFSARDGSLPEWYGDYIGDLVISVASVNSPAAVNGLVGFITTGWGAMDGLVRLGPAALPAVLRAADSSSGIVRSSAAMTLGRMASKAAQVGLTTSDVASIRAKLLAGLADSVPNVRAGFVHALTGFSDEHVRAAVMRLANDPYAVGPATSRIFPVRAAVKEWLRVNAQSGSTDIESLCREGIAAFRVA